MIPIPYSLVLGGVGGDSHSVGLFLLRNYLRSSGYNVHFLGIQNSLEEFFQFAPFANAVLISTLDGHAKHYLSEFQSLLRKYPASGVRWYLGGNLDFHSDIEKTEEYFRSLGFHLVFPKFKSVKGLDEIIFEDLQSSHSRAKSFHLIPQTRQLIESPIVEGKMNLDGFYRQRRTVLDQWPTGKAAVSLSESAEFLTKNGPLFSEVLLSAKRSGQLLLQPRCGVALSEDQYSIFKKFENAGIQVASYQVDSLTRNMRYPEVQLQIQNSSRQGTSSLNGFPIVNHGVETLRQIRSRLRIPLQARHSTRDPRLLAEISYAGGVSSFEGGAICYNLPYYKNYPLSESLERWAYVDRLTALYRDDYGIHLNREFFGTLTATLIPPCLAITVGILEALLAAEQGVRNMSLGYAEQGNRSQDIAAIRCILPLADKYLRLLGYSQVELTSVFHQYMAAFPSDLTLARELIFQSAVTAYLSGATRVMTKTGVEAIGVPSVQQNLDALAWIKLASQAAELELVQEDEILLEMKMIEKEVNCLTIGVLELGAGSVQKGILKAFEKGWLDIPFSPSVFNQGKVITLRDGGGAVRLFDSGELPLSLEIKQWHAERLARRRAYSSRQGMSFLLEDDVQKIAEGRYGVWPLDQNKGNEFKKQVA